MRYKNIKEKSLERWSQILELVLIMIIFVSLSCGLSAVFVGNENFELLRCFIMIIPVIVGYYARKHIRVFSMFIVVHMLLVAGITATSNSFSLGICNFVCVVAYSIYSICMKNKMIMLNQIYTIGKHDNTYVADDAIRSMDQDGGVPYYAGVITIVGYLIGTQTKNAVVMETQTLLGILFIILQIVHGNVHSLYQIFRINSGKNNFPAGQIKRVTGYVTVITSVLVFFGMAVFYKGSYGNIYEIVKNIAYLFFKLIAGLFLLFMGSFGKEGTNNNTVLETETETKETIGETLEAIESSMVAEALAEAFGWILIICIFAFAIYVLIQYINNFNKSKVADSDVIENIKPEEETVKVEKESIPQRHKETKVDKNVRKIYKKLVLKGNKGKSPDKSHTPQRLTKENITDEDALAEEITYIYEKARYSKEQVQKEEVEKMKNVLTR